MRRLLPLALIGLMAGLVAAGPSERPERRGPEASGEGARPGAGQRPRKKGAGKKPKRTVKEGMEARRKAMSTGNSMMEQNSPLGAVAVYRRQLEASPDSAALHVGLGRALVRLGRCSEALGHLAPHVGTVPFGVEAATAAAVCSRRVGLTDDALWYSEIATDLSSENARAFTLLAIILWDLGDVEGVERVFDELLLMGEDRDASLFARAAVALRAGDIDAFDRITARWRSGEERTVDLRGLDAQSWLDVDDPVAAVNALASVRKVRASAQVRLVRGEAFRRMGYPADALDQLRERRQNALEGESADALRARAMADDNQLAEAQKLLAGYADAEDPDLVASRWYVARVAQDTEAMALEADLYAAVNANPLRTLDQLVPLPLR